VNGVGKSTNLSKVAFWCLQNGFSVLIAACDTFRSKSILLLLIIWFLLNSVAPFPFNENLMLILKFQCIIGGAVEQLRVHARNLTSLVQTLHSTNSMSSSVRVQLFEKGYGKDAAGIAKDALAYGKSSPSLFLWMVFSGGGFFL
jgi:signal recognition particle receptor subunit alpha